MTHDLSGQTVKGYDIDERIGTGSFGAVYRAVQPSVGREVAIKIILPEYANHPEFVRRFESEARLVARLEHPYIVPLFDYWREPDCAYLVMRLLPDNLRTILQRGGPLDPAVVIRIIDQIAGALAMSHRQGVVHRDIKPDNILLDDDGNAYLSDFGLAEFIHTSLEQSDEGVTGSPAYMSPEQLKGEPVTPQSDVYALGIVIYEMLTGEHPFDESTISDLIRRHLLDPLPPLHALRPHLPEAIDYVIQRATSKDITQRYDDVLMLAADLHSAVLGDRTLPAIMPPGESIKNPYKGLRPFEEVDASNFFGREALVEQLLDDLDMPHELARFLAIVGPSGSGKSSLVYAGLLPALRRGALPGSKHWFTTTMVPSTAPLTELETALLSVAVKPADDLQQQLRADPNGLVTAVEQVLGDSSDDLLLIIDQFEEVFTLTPNETDRIQFLTLLQNAVTDPHSRVRIVVTLRADFYDRPLLYDSFGALMQARTHIVLPLSESELERAIVSPAERMSVQIEPNLTAAIIADVRAEPGALPLMQYALTEVFERRQGRMMTLQGYEDIGRAAGALARRAERVYMRLTRQQQAIARQLFLRLVNLGEGTEDVRRRASRAELLSAVDDPAQLENVLDIFGHHRLLSFDHQPATREPTVEVAHEALLREWRRLRDWLEDSREDVRQQRRLAGLAAEWKDAGQDSSFLLRGAQLEHVEFWLQNTVMALDDSERDYISASIAIRQRQRAEEQARRAREMALEARARRFQRRLVGVMFVAMLIALGLSLIAIQQRQEAQEARQDAEDNAAIAQIEAAIAATAASVAQERAGELQSLALVADAERALEDNDYDLALALAVAANSIANAPVDAQRLLAEIVPTTATRVFAGHADGANAVAISLDGTRIVSGGDDGSVIVWDTASTRPLRRLTEHSNRIRSVAFLPDGTRVVTGGDNAELSLWDITSGDLVRSFTGHDDDTFTIAIHPDGTRMITGGRDRTLFVWDIATGKQLRTIGSPQDMHEKRITSLAFSPDGTQVVSGSADNTLILWDVATGARIVRMVGHSDSVNDVAFSPNGMQILSASSDNTVILWDVLTHTVINRLQGHTERVSSVAFSPDGRLAISGAGNQFAGGSTDNSLILWDLFLGQPRRRYQGHQVYISDVAYASSGQFIVSASADGTLRQWPAVYDVEVAHHSDTGVAYDAAVFAPEQAQAWVARSDNVLGLHTLDPDANHNELAQIVDVSHSAPVMALALSADGTRLLSASADRTLVLWDVASAEPLHTLTAHTRGVNDAAFSPDGTQAISGSQDRTVRLWDLSTGDLIRTFDTLHTHTVEAVAFSPDGTRALSASRDRSVILWDVTTGEALDMFRGHSDGVHAVVFSPDGLYALSGARDKTIILWELATGRVLRRFGAAGEGHNDWVTALAVSPDGTLLLSGSRDRTVILWDIATGNVLRRDEGHTGTIMRVAFSPDSAYAFSASKDGMTRMWPAARAGLLDWAMSHRYVRPLTCQEQELYRIGECDQLDVEPNRGISFMPPSGN